jgi:hypothetical protein
MVVCSELARAVRRESVAALMHWWAVTSPTVWKWRQALGVMADTPGTRRLRSRAVYHNYAARQGVTDPEEVAAFLAASGVGKRKQKYTAAARRNISAAAKRRTRQPPVRTSFDLWEDEVIRTNPPAVAAYLIGRPMFAIYSRRFRLGVNKKHRR